MSNRLLYLSEHLEPDAKAKVLEINTKIHEVLTPKWSDDPAVLPQQKFLHESIVKRIGRWGTSIKSFATVFDPETQRIEEVCDWAIVPFFNATAENLENRIKIIFGAYGVYGMKFSLNGAKYANGRTIWCGSEDDREATATAVAAFELAKQVGGIYKDDFTSKACQLQVAPLGKQ